MDSWNLGGFDEGSFKAAEKAQLKKYEDFLNTFSEQVGQFNETFGLYSTPQWDPWHAPLDFSYQANEAVDFHTLIRTDNKIFNKVLIAITAMCCEVNHLVEEAHSTFIPALLFYKEATLPPASGDSPALTEMEKIPLSMGRFMTTIQRLLCFVQRSNEVIRHVMQQLTCLYALSAEGGDMSGLAGKPALAASQQFGQQQSLFDASGVHLLSVFQCLLRLLSVLVTLDTIFTNSLTVRNDWDLYKRLLTSAKNDPKKYALALEQLRPFEKLLMNLEARLLDGRIFKLCVEQDFDDATQNVLVSRSSMLAKYMESATRMLFARIESRVDAPETLELQEREDFIGLCALFTLYVRLFSTNSADKKLFKELFNFTLKLPVVSMCNGRFVWYGSEFLLQCLPELCAQMLDRKAVTRAHDRRDSYLQERMQLLQKDMEASYWRVTQWMINMDTPEATVSSLDGAYTFGGKQAKDLWIAKTELLLRGLYYANRLRQHSEVIVALVNALKRPLTKSLSLLLCRALELCKAIHMVYVRKSHATVTSSMPQLLQFLAGEVASCLLAAKNRVVQSSDKAQRLTQRKVDVLSALMLAQHAAYGPATPERLLVLQLALAVAAPLCAFKDEESAYLNSLIRKMDLISSLAANIQNYCDCSFFYWFYPQVLPLYVHHLYKSGGDIWRLQFMLTGLHDPVRYLLATTHEESPEMLATAYGKHVYTVLEEQLLVPLSREVETDLRLHSHSHLLVMSGQFNPLVSGGSSAVPGVSLPSGSSSAGLPASASVGGRLGDAAGGIGTSQEQPRRQLTAFLRARPFQCFHTFLNIKGYVEQYLEKVYFEMTAVYPGEWRTYSEMRKLAEQRLGLHIEELHLPSQTLEQGLDVLNIMRNMDTFSATYHYNLNQQEFLQMRSDSKFLFTVGPSHVANSIRTHGMGIMSTTVNYTYIFLKTGFSQFSEFLFDERIKGKVLKEWQEFKETCLSKEILQFPFEFADRLKRNIRKMHVYPDGSDPLERFRAHITRMGNAIAFVRLIRTGCLRCCGEATSALVGLDFTDDLEELARDCGFGDTVQTGAKMLDQVIRTLHRVLEKDTDYFKMLVDVFAGEFRANRFIHCRNFYILLPALTISQVEHLITSKEQLTKKKKEGATFVDDGFCVGVAYILKVLNLHKEFDSLHWFRSVREYYYKKKVKLQQQVDSAKVDEKLRQAHVLTLKRLDTLQQEFHVLACQLQSARTIFRADQQMVATQTLGKRLGLAAPTATGSGQGGLENGSGGGSSAASQAGSDTASVA